ncbi:MAG TPA: NADH-quinone oxidoreductase subunit NuoH [Myxococcota bacterium]|nr:NADH-quinone oxidoreductase subunit NuoH [Myxococcota bacterium]HRY92721.1 NADH-quinone oxidoreductase subunit NuoH [Myxococcota bacterium]HSA23587.1 NADH-quinone oxidoreductase subunit NuoH [Myxococcota bacterium]
MNPLWLGLVLTAVKLVVVLAALLTMAAYMVWVERRLLARMQLRLGPNRVGWFGLLQPLADVIKMLAKEDTVPAQADRWVFLLAPAVTACMALLTFAVVPFGPPLSLFGQEVPMVVSDLNIGVLFFLGLSSLGVYGVALGGWASSSKFALMGAVRGLAQLISYELSMSLALVPVLMLAGSFSLSDIVAAQAEVPFVVYAPVSFAIFLVSILAESRRTPFDLPEAESELVAGYHTEYSGMRFGLYFVGEYINMIVLGALTTVLFLGGWHGPWLPGLAWFLLKVGALAFFFIWVRGTLPRLRYDQVMHLGWKVLLPLALVNLLVTAGILLGVRA